MSGWFVIWSEEHSAWWAPGERDYTNSLRRAGRYTEARAKEIEAAANRYLNPGVFAEVALPDPIWIGFGAGKRRTLPVSD
jgi:hypothetical protein